jgi:non-ribosomal peptide synthetase component E (peptide arylation enzyme)
MDPIEKRELKRKAWMRLAAQRRRAGLLRGRVVVLSLVCFALLWSVVFVQMATGNDPVLSAKQKAAEARTVATVKKATVKPDPRREPEPEFFEPEPEPEFFEPEPEPEPLVTSQS